MKLNRKSMACVYLAVLLGTSSGHAQATATAEPSAVQKAGAAAKEAETAKVAAQAAANAAKAMADQAAGLLASAEQTLAAARTAAANAAALAKSAQGDMGPVANDCAAKAAGAAKSAEEAVAAAKLLADRASAGKAAAEKVLGEKAAAHDRAARTVLAERAFAARMAVRQSVKEKADADKAVAQKAEAAAKAAAEVTAAEQGAAAAAAARIAAEKTLAELTAQVQAAAEKARVAADAAAKAAAEQAAASVQAARGEAEKALAAKVAAADAGAQQLAAAKTKAQTLAGEKAAAEQSAAQRAAAIVAALDTASAAEAEALGGLKPIASGQWDYDKARHLLWRAGFGGPPDEVEKLHAMGLHAAAEYLVNRHKQPPCTLVLDVQPPQRPLGYENLLDAKEREQLGNERNSQEQSQQPQLRQWWLRRMAESPRPLEEKLTLFWHDHFATGYEDKIYQTHLLYQQNEMLRQFAFKFDALLRGIVRDPAMILYLDNQANVKGRGNENLGREVLELFALGRDQGYTEQDLRELSRALTGYSYVGHINQFRFNGSQHDETPKTILGRTGNFSADEAIDVVLAHPATARYVARKLFEFFAHRQPSEEIVDRLAHVLRDNQYELAPMLTNLFTSEEFYSERSIAQQIKSPVELMIGTIRALRIGSVNWAGVDWETQNMGMTLFQPPNVGGWEEGRSWISANRVMLRYNGVANLVEQPHVDAVALIEGKAATAEQIVDSFARACLAGKLSPQQRTLLVEFLGAMPPVDQWTAQRPQINARLRALLVLMMSIPEYQVN